MRSNFKEIKMKLLDIVYNICKNCGKEYSRSEVIRKYGDFWWSPIFCTPECLKEFKEKK